MFFACFLISVHPAESHHQSNGLDVCHLSYLVDRLRHNSSPRFLWWFIWLFTSLRTNVLRQLKHSSKIKINTKQLENTKSVVTTHRDFQTTVIYPFPALGKKPIYIITYIFRLIIYSFLLFIRLFKSSRLLIGILHNSQQFVHSLKWLN